MNRQTARLAVALSFVLVLLLPVLGCHESHWTADISGTVTYMESYGFSSDNTLIRMQDGEAFVLVGENPLEVGKTYSLHVQSTSGSWILHYKLLSYELVR